MAVLHVTNGAAAAGDLRALGEVLSWDDILHEGPVPPLAPAALRDVRARFLADAGFADLAGARAALERRDARLEAVDFSTPVVLWFEDDLYDQLQVVQVLDRLADRHGPVQLAHLPRGPRTFLRHRLGAARTLGDAECDLARRAWAAITAPDPRGVQDLWLAGSPGLPDLAPALERLLEEHPSTTDGLARSERQMLIALDDGPLHARDLFAAATAAEERPYFGDTTLWWRAARLDPLVVRDDQGLFALGPAARDVLVGRTDAVEALGGLDRWVGGVHHRGAPAWRWDPTARRLAGTVE